MHCLSSVAWLDHVAASARHVAADGLPGSRSARSLARRAASVNALQWVAL
jgi:hypothetical protein